MNKSWPGPFLFVLAAFLFVKGCTLQSDGQKYMADHPAVDFTTALTSGHSLDYPGSERSQAKTNINTGGIMQIAGGVIGAAGLLLAGLAMVHRKVQTSALTNRLAVTYEFVSVVPVENIALDTTLLTEDQAVARLQSQYPTLAKTAAEKLRRDFAEKRRTEPTKIWYVKGLEVREVDA